MPEHQPWSSNAAVLNYARVLRALVTDYGEHDAVGTASLVQFLGLSSDEVGMAFDALARDRLVTPMHLRAADRYASTVMLQSTGRERVAQWDAAASAAGIRRACRAAFLTWLDDVKDTSPSSSEDFLGTTHAHFTGIPFTTQTLGTTVAELHDLDLISGMKLSGDPIIRPRLTALGTTVLDQFDGDVARWQAGPTATSTSIVVTGSQNVNVASHSPGAQQTAQTITAARSAVQDVADALDQILASRAADLELAPADLARAYALVPQLREAAAQVEVDPEPARRRLESVRTIFVAGSGSALGVGLVALAEQAAQLVVALA